jgi:hypothetical protein
MQKRVHLLLKFYSGMWHCVAKQSNNHLTLNMTVLQSTEPWRTTHPTMCHIQQYINPQQQCCENLISLREFLIFKSHIMIDPKPFRNGHIFKWYFWPKITNTNMNRMFWIILFVQGVYFIISNSLICTGCLFYHEQTLYLYRVSPLTWKITFLV